MIQIRLQPEPANFDCDVRAKGNAYLIRNPRPSSRQFGNNAHWKSIITYFRKSYQQICAYTGFLIHCGSEVDHYKPKVKYPKYAYEWSNYRLSYGRINQYKGDFEDILDPFQIQNGWFILDFPSCLVKAGSSVNDQLKLQIEATISRLKLNDDDELVQNRLEILMAYAGGDCSFQHLERYYPFIATELKRQNLQDDIKIMLNIN